MGKEQRRRVKEWFGNDQNIPYGNLKNKLKKSIVSIFARVKPPGYNLHLLILVYNYFVFNMSYDLLS